MMKAAILLALVGQSLAQPQSSWFSGLRDKARSAVAASSDMVEVKQLFGPQSTIQVESCGTTEHAMHVESVHFDSETLRVTARGTLTREIQGGNVMAGIHLGAAPSEISLKEKFMRQMAFSVSGQHTASEPLCSHFARTSEMTCPLARGTKELSFSFNKLPSVVSAGVYHLKLDAVDEMEKPVACLHGQFNVPLGPNGERYRRLDAHAQTVSGTTSQVIGFSFIVALLTLALQ